MPLVASSQNILRFLGIPKTTSLKGGLSVVESKDEASFQKLASKSLPLRGVNHPNSPLDDSRGVRETEQELLNFGLGLSKNSGHSEDTSEEPSLRV